MPWIVYWCVPRPSKPDVSLFAYYPQAVGPIPHATCCLLQIAAFLVPLVTPSPKRLIITLDPTLHLFQGSPGAQALTVPAPAAVQDQSCANKNNAALNAAIQSVAAAPAPAPSSSASLAAAG